MYISKYTDFTAYNKPLTNTIYYKHGNETIIIIYIDDDWNMTGTVQHPEYFTIGLKKMTLNQKECEKLLMRNMPPKNRKETLKCMGLDKYDSAEILYRTRGINLLDNSWFAWNESDKIEDYHPLVNKKLLNDRSIDDITEPSDDELPSIIDMTDNIESLDELLQEDI